MKYDSFKVIRALSSETRYKIAHTLAKHKKIAVQDIAAELGMTHSAISHQLAVLSGAKVVESAKEGRMQMYKISKTPAGKTLRALMRV